MVSADGGHEKWQTGPNQALKLEAGASSVLVNDSWHSSGGREVLPDNGEYLRSANTGEQPVFGEKDPGAEDEAGGGPVHGSYVGEIARDGAVQLDLIYGVAEDVVDVARRLNVSPAGADAADANEANGMDAAVQHVCAPAVTAAAFLVSFARRCPLM